MYLLESVEALALEGHQLTPTVGQNHLQTSLPNTRGGAQVAAWAVGDGWEWGAAPWGWGQLWRCTQSLPLWGPDPGKVTIQQAPAKAHTHISAGPDTFFPCAFNFPPQITLPLL